MNNKNLKLRGFGLAVLVFCIVATGSIARAGGLDLASVGKCKECHEKQLNSFTAGNPHAKLWEHSSADKVFSCESCHGSGEKHMKDREASSIIGFGKGAAAKADVQNKQCLTCHTLTNKLSFWEMSKHKKEGVSCASCHSMHKGGDAVKPSAETCFTCHKDVRAQVNKRSHHPIIEGKVSCFDCHNPHGTLNPKMVLAETPNLLCLKCHADKRGPFMWEHQPVEENCMTCHTPHGSVHGKLLIQQVPQLCKDCHMSEGHGSPDARGGFAAVPGFPTFQIPQFMAKGCLNCHSRIHGSNAPGTGASGLNNGMYFLR